MDARQYNYYAFISYQRKDEKWAKWLQRKLENYKLPVTNAKDSSDKKPRYIRPVFRDKTDLTAGPLPDMLKEALNQSRYLIVICSPNAVQSPWVNDEINTFVNVDRTNCIIPFIVDGQPYSDDKSKECFPDALKAIPKEQEPIGVSISEVGKKRAFIRTVTYMLGVKFDVLWNRYERQRRKKRTISFACIAFLAVIALGIYDYTRTKVEYYADWVDCNGIAKGVIPLTDEQYSHRYASYKFEYTRVPFGEKGFYSWRLNKVSLVNSKGVISNNVPDNHPFFYPVQEYKYTDGYVTEIINRDTYNRVVMRYSIKDDYDHKKACLIDMEGKEKHQGSAYLSGSTTAFLSDANSSSTMSKIKRFHYTRNEKGYITKVTYHANDADELDESAIGDNNNIYGKVFELDSLGRVTKVSYVNHEGNPMTDKYGVGSIRYNNAGFEGNDTIEYLDSNGNLVYNEHRFARQAQKLDKYGNPIEQWCEGADEKPCYDYKNVYRQVFVFDENGCLKEMDYYDIDGNLSYCADNYAIERGKYDSRGRCIEAAYYDINNQPCYTKNGFSISRVNYDKNDCLIERCFYDIYNKPCNEKEYGVHIIKTEYDNFNYIVDQAVFDKDDNPSITPNYGFHRQIYIFDDYHRITSSKVFGTDGIPCINTQEYCCEGRYSYDSRGNQIKVECLDINGKPCVCKDGFATIIYKYDNFGNCIEEGYFGIYGEPIYINMCASIQYDYYPNGLLKEKRFYDEKGTLCLNTNWYAISRYEYDINGNLTSVSYFDKDTIPCYYKEGLYSRMEFNYDNNGNVIQETSFDSKGRIALMFKGLYAIAKYRYDKHRRVVEYAYFNEKGAPCFYDNDYHILRVVYDSMGNIIKHTIYGVDGRPGLSRENTGVIKYEYDKKNNLVRKDFEDAKGNNVNQRTSGYSTEIISYDEMSRIVRCEYLDMKGDPCMINCPYSDFNMFYSSSTNKYDDMGNCIEYAMYDKSGKYTNSMYYAIKYQVYDNLGRVIEEKFKNSEGRLTQGGNHHMSILRYNYNNNSNYVSDIMFYDTDSVLQAHLYQTIEKGFITRKEIRDKDNKLKSMHIYGFTDVKCAIMTDSINEYGQNIKRSYYGEDGKLGNTEEGIAILLNTYDQFGRIIIQEVFDEKGRPVCGCTSKFHKRVVRYDERGLIAENSYFDENGYYVNTPWLYGYCREVLDYDERGIINNNTSKNYYSVNGKAVDEKELYNRGTQVINKIVEGSLVLANVELPGLFKENGYDGLYCIVEWNEWNMYDDITRFSEVFHTSLPNDKHLLIVPVTDQGLGEIIDLSFPAGVLGIRIVDAPYNALYNDLAIVYESYKKAKKQGF